MRFSSSRVSMRSVFLMTCNFYRLSRSSASIYQGLSKTNLAEWNWICFFFQDQNISKLRESSSNDFWNTLKTYTSRCPFLMGTHQESQHPLLVHLLRAVLYSALSRQSNMETQRKGQRKQQNNSERGTCRRLTKQKSWCKFMQVTQKATVLVCSQIPRRPLKMQETFPHVPS